LLKITQTKRINNLARQIAEKSGKKPQRRRNGEDLDLEEQTLPLNAALKYEGWPRVG